MNARPAPVVLPSLREIGEWLIQMWEHQTTAATPQALPLRQATEYLASATAANASFEDSTTASSDMLLSRLAKEEFDERLRRRQFLDADLLGEPGWDMLLDLFVHGVAGMRISTTSVCIASGVPTTTALRWVELLVSKGLVTRMPDPQDRRRTWITLSDAGYDLMGNYLKSRAAVRLRQPVPFKNPLRRNNDR